MENGILNPSYVYLRWNFYCIIFSERYEYGHCCILVRCKEKLPEWRGKR